MGINIGLGAGFPGVSWWDQLGCEPAQKKKVAPAVCLVLESPKAVCLSSRDTPGMDTTGIRTHGGDVSSQTEGINRWATGGH